MDGPIDPDCPGCRELRKEIAELRRLLDELRRGGKRQAAPFSKGRPKLTPKTPGRKPGEGYGTHHRRTAPERIDEVHHAELPAACPHCDGTAIEETHVAEQFQTEVRCEVVERKFVVHVGECRGCGVRVRGRHPLQTSDALGAAGRQLGARTHALFAWLNKGLGLSHGKVQVVFERLFGLRLSRATSCRSMLRTAARAAPAVAAIHREIRGSPVVTPDETGWRIGGRTAWLHVAVGASATVVQIDRSRGHEPLARLIGLDYAGRLVHDGWSAYDRFARATHQQCLTHLSKRCHELLETATRGAVRFPRAVRELLREGLAARDRFVAGALTPRGLAWWRTHLTNRLSEQVRPLKSHAGNERLAQFLERHLAEVFAFLEPLRHVVDGRPILTILPATNHRAEQAIRPSVVNRKVWGGNRTDRGAAAQSTVSTILLTAAQRHLDPLAWLTNLHLTPQPILLPSVGR